MIDCENEIFDFVAEKTIEKFPEIYFTGEFVQTPPILPCCCLIEKDNYTYKQSLDTSCGENHANLMYELSVYSNKMPSKKAQCKEIAAFVDDILIKLNFIRMMLSPIENVNDRTIYRMLGRYRAIISKDKTIYRR